MDTVWAARVPGPKTEIRIKPRMVYMHPLMVVSMQLLIFSFLERKGNKTAVGESTYFLLYP